MSNWSSAKLHRGPESAVWKLKGVIKLWYLFVLRRAFRGSLVYQLHWDPLSKPLCACTSERKQLWVSTQLQHSCSVTLPPAPLICHTALSSSPVLSGSERQGSVQIFHKQRRIWHIQTSGAFLHHSYLVLIICKPFKSRPHGLGAYSSIVTVESSNVNNGDFFNAAKKPVTICNLKAGYFQFLLKRRERFSTSSHGFPHKYRLTISFHLAVIQHTRTHVHTHIYTSHYLVKMKIGLF